jgi:hypothetical protein
MAAKNYTPFENRAGIQMASENQSGFQIVNHLKTKY